MIIVLESILSEQDLSQFRAALGPDAPWRPGAVTAGGQAAQQKDNWQLAQDSDTSRQLQPRVVQALQADPRFFSATLPAKVFNPLFNRYDPDAPAFGPHIDGAVMHSRQTGQRVRTDVSCTVFLSDPAEYDGGELVIHDTYGMQSVKLPAGAAVLYPATSLHEVRPVTRGQRLASFLWVESMVRSDEQRRLLYDMDMNLLRLRAQLGETRETIALTGVYHNLLRQWAAV